ncbi:histone-lysine N-methyltransferase SETD1B-like isoform X2 [Macrobrachium nipponense]
MTSRPTPTMTPSFRTSLTSLMPPPLMTMTTTTTTKKATKKGEEGPLLPPWTGPSSRALPSNRLRQTCPGRPGCPDPVPEAPLRPVTSTRRSIPTWASPPTAPHMRNPVPPPAILTPPRGDHGVRRQMSEDRSRLKRHEEEGRRQPPRRQRSEDTRLRRDDMSSSSGDLMTLDVRDVNSRSRPKRDGSRGRSRDTREREPPAAGGGRESSKEQRHLRKSRSGDVDVRRVPTSQEQGRRRRSRSSDRWLDHQEHLLEQQQQQQQQQQRRMVEAGMIDPRLIDPSMIDPRLIDPRLIDPRLIDPRYMDEPYPLPQDPIRFPHLMSYPPPMSPQAGHLSPGSMSPGAMSPIPPGAPMGPPFIPMEFAPYPMYPFEMGYIPDAMMGSEMAFLPPPPPHPHHPAAFPGDIPPEFLHPPEFLPQDYPLDYPLDFPLDYGPLPRNPAMMGGGPWVDPGVHPRDDWPPPTPEQAQKLIHSVVRNPSRSSGDDDANDEGGGGYPQQHRFGRRLTSVGHSDSSGLSSPSEERRILNTNTNSSNKRKISGYRGVNASFRDSGNTHSSEFRVGEPVRESSPRVPMKNSSSLPHFISGKDSGFDEAPVVTEEGNNTVTRGGRPSGGAFIVSGVFNDSSRMFIPAPPSPTPDYDDDDVDGDSDGNESDILHGSQFYVTGSPGYPLKKKLGNRDSLSDDSLQSTPIITSKSTKSSTPSQTPSTPLQTMIKEFHQGLPPPDNENGFSDDSLEDSTASPSGPSSVSQRPLRQNSVESLVSMESSTASFDYMNEGQARNSSYGQTKLSPVSSGPGNTIGSKGCNARDRKDVNGKVKKSLSKSPENECIPKGNGKENESKGEVNNFSRENSRESSNSTGSNGSKPTEKFETIRSMLKEGLIEGLDESPPKFKPPPPSKKTPNEERADSGISSIVSTARTDESGGSDNRSDFSGTPPSLTSPRDAESSKDNRLESKKGKESVRSHASVASEDLERNRDEGDEVEVAIQETMEVPPPPPPRDESMHWTPRTNPPRDHSRISLRATPTTPTPLSHRDISRSSLRSAPSTPSTSKNNSWLHTGTPGKDEILEVASNYSHYSTGDKITHVDDLYGQNEQIGSGSEVSSAINGSLASHYSIQDSDNPLTDREFLENLKNLEPRPRPDTLAVITEDQGSIGSKGSRSGRLLSRIADTVRSGSRTPTPNSSSGSNTRATTTKLTSTSRASTRIHGDIIREPWRSSLRESALPSPQEFNRLPSLSPSIIPLTRDGSGRFRSIEDLAEAVSEPSQQEVTLSGKRKKHSTLPPNLTPADMKKENKELRRATSLMVGKKGKENGEGSKFRFNFFRGFWRRKQYSFDNKM